MEDEEGRADVVGEGLGAVAEQRVAGRHLQAVDGEAVEAPGAGAAVADEAAVGGEGVGCRGRVDALPRVAAEVGGHEAPGVAFAEERRQVVHAALGDGGVEAVGLADDPRGEVAGVGSAREDLSVGVGPGQAGGGVGGGEDVGGGAGAPVLEVGGFEGAAVSARAAGVGVDDREAAGGQHLKLVPHGGLAGTPHGHGTAVHLDEEGSSLAVGEGGRTDHPGVDGVAGRAGAGGLGDGHLQLAVGGEAAPGEPGGVVRGEALLAAGVDGAGEELVGVGRIGGDVDERGVGGVVAADAASGRGEHLAGDARGHGGVDLEGVGRGFVGDLLRRRGGAGLGGIATGERGEPHERKAALRRRDGVEVPSAGRPAELRHRPVVIRRDDARLGASVEREEADLGLRVAAAVEAAGEEGDRGAVSGDLRAGEGVAFQAQEAPDARRRAGSV